MKFAFASVLILNSVLRGGYGIFYGSSSLYRMDEYSDTYPFLDQRDLQRRNGEPAGLNALRPLPGSQTQRGRRDEYERAG